MSITTDLSNLNLQGVNGATQYDRYVAVRSYQGKRPVYTIQIALTDVPLVLPVPDPDRPTLGNRRVNLQHAKSFGGYVRQNENWVAPPLLVRDDGQCVFEPQTDLPAGMALGILCIPRTSKIAIKIVDGQHRVLGVTLEIRDLEQQIDRLKEELARARGDESRRSEVAGELAVAEGLYERLRNEHLTLQVYVEHEPVSYEQMFYDVADNALGINQAVKVRFDSRKVLNRTLYECAKHPLLAGRIDEEQDRIGSSNPNLVGAKHVVDLVRSANVGVAGRIGPKREAELDESTLVETANEFFDCLLEGFEKPLEDLVEGSITAQELRANNLLGSVTMLRVLAGVFYRLREAEWSPDEVKDFFTKLAPHMSAPVRKDSVWIQTEDITVGAFGPMARSQNLRHLTDSITDWAVKDVSL